MDPSSGTAEVLPAPQQPVRQRRGSTIDDRIRLLAAELDLDAKQQAQVRRLLERQREQVREAWSRTATPSAYRIGATQAISERTADEIRALLNDEQRKKYLAARQPRAPADGGSSLGLDFWMDPSRAAK